MALLFGRQRRAADFAGASAQDLIPQRSISPSAGIPAVTSDTAMRHSAVWACLRLRANLISTFPVDVFRRVDGRQIEVPKPPVLVNPGGDRVGFPEWCYSTQVDLDRGGNAFGLITARSGTGLPARIDLQPLSEVTVRVKDGRISKYRIGGVEHDPVDVWHEKQYTLAGLHVGLSPVAYAAWSIGEYLSIQDFALTWFGNGGVPRAHLRNKLQTITPAAAQTVKERFKASVHSGDVFVTGSDWEYQMIQAEQTGMEWLDAKRYSVGDVARFFDCPGDLIDAAVATGSITYANVTQRNLQFLTMHLGPSIVRRELALSTKLLAQPRYMKFNTDALMRMDPKSRADAFAARIAARTLAPSEARELDNLPPFTEAQLAEFDQLFPPKAQPPAATPSTGGAP